jgi:Ca2+/H+ antiporter, TMEM165/GDT1 family
VEAFLISTGAVALAEIGDKTQLLALVLAARFRRPWPIILGILLATLANHAAAGLLGSWISRALSAELLRWMLGVSFIAMAVWALAPDHYTIREEGSRPRMGVFLTTLIAFFVVEMGDKTQIATVVLAARYEALFAIVCGTTLGMMIANVPAVLLGDALAKRVPLRIFRAIAAMIFAVLGILVLAGG